MRRSSLSAQTKRPATFDDVLNIKAVQGATISPDGRTVIYGVRQWVDRARHDGIAHAHLAGCRRDGNSPARQISFGEKGDSQAQFSPDGKFISFVSARGGADAKPQIYLMPIDGGEAWKLTDAKESVSSYSWAPDSSRIAFVATDPRIAGRRSQHQEARRRARVRRRLPFAHAWVIDVNSKQATRITEGTQWTVQGAPSWSPDGKQFVFGAATTPMLRDNRRDVSIIGRQLASRQQARSKRSAPNWGNDGTPRWSQDGRTIAWVGEPNTTSPLPDGTAAGVVMQQRLMLYDVKAKTIKDTLTPNFDSEAGAPIWTNEGTRVMFVTGKRAYNEAFAYDITSGTYTQLTRNKHHQRHLDQQGRQDDRRDDGCAGFGDGDLRHRSVVREPQAADQHQPAARRGRSRARRK